MNSDGRRSELADRADEKLTRTEAILSATESLLKTRELRSLTIQEIVSQVGINRATFYFYFSSKYDVVARLLEQHRDEVLDAVEPWTGIRRTRPEQVDIVDHGDYATQLAAAFTTMVRVWQEHHVLLRAVAENWRSVPELRSGWQASMKWFADCITARIEADRRLGVAPAGHDARQLATGLLLMNVGLLQNLFDSEPLGLEVDSTVRTMCAIWEGAIYGTGSRP